MNYVEGEAGGLSARSKGQRKRVEVERDGSRIMVTIATVGIWHEQKVRYTPEQAVALADLLMATARPMLPSNQKHAWNREHPHKLREYRQKYNERLKQQKQEAQG